MPLLTADGRGLHYSPARGIVEAVARVAYRGDWPGRLWGLLPRAARVDGLDHSLAILPPGLPPLRLAFASDLHLGPTTSRATLDAAFGLLNAWSPDLLVLGGDFVFLEATDARALELGARVAEVPARKKYAVLGNHDLWTHHPRLERALEAAGVELLINRSLPLPHPWGGVHLVGLDDPWTGTMNLEAALDGVPAEAIRLGVVHSPDGAPLLATAKPALILAGHTHGGQVALPGGRPVVVPGRMGRTWPWGLHLLDHGGWLFVSRGVGGVEIPMRLHAPSDVGLFTLTSTPTE